MKPLKKYNIGDFLVVKLNNSDYNFLMKSTYTTGKNVIYKEFFTNSLIVQFKNQKPKAILGNDDLVVEDFYSIDPFLDFKERQKGKIGKRRLKEIAKEINKKEVVKQKIIG